MVMPVAGKLGSGGAKLDPPREPAAPPPPPRETEAGEAAAVVVDSGSLAEIWKAATATLAERPQGGSRLARYMPLLRAARLEGKTLIVEKPRDAPKLVESIVSADLREAIEEEISRRLGGSIRLEMREIAETLKVEGALRAARPSPDPAPQPEAKRPDSPPDDGPIVLSDEDLRAEMKRHAPPREKLRQVLAESDTLSRGVDLLREMIDGEVVAVNGEEL